MHDQALWTPNRNKAATLKLASFIAFINEKYQVDFQLDDYPGLHQWSVTEREQFWQACWDFFGVIHQQKPDSILENGGTMENSQWFKGARLNFAQNLLELNLENPQTTALIEYNEQGQQGVLSYAELYEQVKKLACRLKSMGLQSGDRVVACMPNCMESVIAMLATTSLGGIWSSCSPDFGAQGMLDRFEQIEAKVLFTCRTYQYNGKVIDIENNISKLCQNLDTLQHVIVLDDKFSGLDVINSLQQKIKNKQVLRFQNCLETSQEISGKKLPYASLPFDHPLYIMFSSGTTGLPKCIVHGAGGTLLQHLKEHQLHADLHSNDVLFFFTTCGWMMWNWLVSGLASKATLVLYDGSPFYPAANTLFDIAEKENITHFGVGAKFISAIEKQGFRAKDSHQLTNMRMMLSTGSPLVHESFDYVYRDIKQDLCLASISGGTDIISCFVLGNPALPVYRGEIQCKGLGMDVDIVNEQGQSISGEKGELICRKSFPSMPLYFWNDEDGKRMHKAYFQQFENCWAHGDYAELTAHDGFIIHGRSDAVLNPGGVRIGTAEIYRQVEKVEDVLESIVVGRQDNDDVQVLLFVVLKEGQQLDEGLIGKIKSSIRNNASPRHVPHAIIQVPDIPRTKSGKIVELAVKEIVNGGEVKNTEALANPEALGFFKELVLPNSKQ